MLAFWPHEVRAQVTETQEDVQETSLSFGLDAEVGFLSFENEYGDGERFLSSVLAPTFERGLWSGGLRFRFRWNQRGLRDEDYDENADYLAILRFVQYSDKDEPGFYVRLGDIDRDQIGYGQFINQYRNTLSLDNPQTGMVLDRIEDRYKVESLFSSFATPSVFGARVGFKPFLEDSSATRQSVAFGITIAGDVSDEARLENPYRNGLPFFDGQAPIGADTLRLGSAVLESPLTMLGFDVSAPVFLGGIDELTAYAELGNIFGFGSGLGLGVEGVDRRGNWRIKGWLEQRLLGREYVPSYFNSIYERDRLRSTTVTLADGTEVDAINTKRNRLYRRDEVEFGSYLGMEVRYTRHYRVRWSLEHSWTRDQSGWFEFDIRISDPDLPFQLRYVFDQVNMDGLGDILNGPPENALHRLELAYLIRKHILVGFRFRQSFDTIENLGRTVGHRKQTHIEPAIIIRV